VLGQDNRCRFEPCAETHATLEDLSSVYNDDGLEEQMRGDRDEQFTAFVAASARRLRQTAFLLCADWHQADDAVQSALVKLYLNWDTVQARESMESFVRTILVRGLIDESRRPWRRESSWESLPDVPQVEQLSEDDRLFVRQMLAQVPPRQRAVLVLRYFLDCDVAETARVISCSEGTVKSQTARGLERLRHLFGETESMTVGRQKG
jgi:RNA polymerase sigma-70 factor (sigma-E family)